MKRIITIFFIAVISTLATAQPVVIKKSYKTFLTSSPPVIDGVFDDEAWNSGEWAGDFIQYEPNDGKPATQKTEFKVLFDENNIYVAIKAYDSSPDSIVKRVTRRDDTDGDVVGIALDSYHDLRTGFIFIVSAAGAKEDFIMSNDGNNQDDTWDPIWFTKAEIYDWGYGVEMKIPLSQLRFSISEGGTWGMTIVRVLARKQEQTFWSYIPRNSSGIVHQFGEITGLDGIKPTKQADLTPFTVASIERSAKEDGNPFATGKASKINAGIDGKIGITNNMTLDFTLNPDFGQVEADPSQVNLTAFETFYEEKRPFFVEGKNITSFSVGIGDGDLGNDNLFYSRRIGRSPHLWIDTEDNEFVKAPRQTSIIGATKITGKTPDGLSIGILEAVTAEEKAETDSLGERSFKTVEPLTNYVVTRVIKDFNSGNTILGGGYTNTHRFLEGTGIDGLVRSANTGGLDFTQYFKDKNWFFSATAAFSHLSGDTAAIENLQESSVHYYQRTDANYVEVDPSRKSLGGHGGNVQFGKTGGKWKFVVFGLWKSPGFDLNDVGYLRAADDIGLILWSSYLIDKPFSIFRNIRFNSNQWNEWDWGGNFLDAGGNFSIGSQFKNLWYLNLNSNYDGNSISNTMLRGGPAVLNPPTLNYSVYLSTNGSKKLFLEGSFYSNIGKYKSSESFGVEASATFKPGKSFSVSLSPSYSTRENKMQYITTQTYGEESRYILGTISQKIAMMSVRINYNITPELTIQYWGQPFLASMDYRDFKMITDPKADKFTDRFHTYQGTEISYNPDDNFYSVDENKDGSEDYSFDNPNLNVNVFLSNLVARWEFRPGSTLFLVWSQSRDYYDAAGKFEFRDNLTNLFTEERPSDIFLIKFTYRFGLR